MELFSFPFDNVQGGTPDFEPGSLAASAEGLRQFGFAPPSSSSRPEFDPFVKDDGFVTLVDGTKIGVDRLLQAGDAGIALYDTAKKIQNGKTYGFTDAYREAPLLSYFPFFGMFASVGKSIMDAHDVANYFEKSARGEATTEDEAIKATLYMNENHLRSEGGLGYTVGTITQMMPSFFAEMGILGAAGGALRTRAAERVAANPRSSEAAAANLAFSSAYRSGVRASAGTVVDKFVEAGGNLTELLSSRGAYRSALAETARLSRGVYDAGYNMVRGFHPQWAPGLLDKAIMHESDRALRRAISMRTANGKMARFWNGFKDSVADAARSGLYDMGSWGTDGAMMLDGASMSWKRAALDGLTDLTVGAAVRGGALFLPRQAVVSAIGAATGAESRSKLGLLEAAWQNKDPDLLESAWWRGLGADLLEYVSENTGRGFNSLFRAAGLKFFPKAFASAKGVVGNAGRAVLAKDASGALTGVQFNGLVDPSQYSKVGGRLRQLVETRWGAKAMNEKVAADRYRAVEWMLGEKGISVGNSTALQQTIMSGELQPGLSAAVANELGRDVKGYVKGAVRAANKAGAEGLKLDSYIKFTLADKLARNNIDPIRAWEWFQKVGYDGVVGEMLEERYNDVAQALFGFDANSDRSFAGKLKAAWEAKLPDGQQLLAELIGFSVPMLARGGIMRGIAALGGQNAFERRMQWASLFSEASKFNVPVEVAPYGAYLRKADEQTARLSAHADELAQRAAAARAEGRESEAVQLETETERYRAGAKRSADVKTAFADSLTQGQLAEMSSAQERAAEIRARAAERTAEAARLGEAGDAEGAARARGQAEALEALAKRTADGPLLAVPMPSDALLASSESEFASRALPGTESVARSQLSAAQLFVKGFAEYAQGSYKLENRTEEESRGWFRRASRWVGEAALRLSGVAATGDVGFLSVNPAEWHAEDAGVPGGLLDEGKQIYAKAYASALNQLQSEATDAHLREGGESATPARASAEEAHGRALEMARPVLEETATRWLALRQVRMFAAEDLRDFALKDVAEKAGLVVDAERGVVRDPRVGAESEKPLETFASEHSDEIEAAVAHDAELLYTALTQGEGADRRRVYWDMPDPSRAVRAVLAIPPGSPTADRAVAAQAMADAVRVARMASPAGLPALRNMTDVAKDVTGDRTAGEELAGTAARREFVDALAETLLPGGARLGSRSDFDAALERIKDADPALVATVSRDLGYDVLLDGTAEGVEARDRAVARHVLQESLSRDPDTALYVKPVLTPTEEQRRLGAAREMVDVAVREPSGRWRLFPHTDDMRQSKDPVYASSLEEMDRVLADPRFGYGRASQRTVYGSVRELVADDPVSMIKTLGLGGEYIHRSRLAAGDDENCLDPALRHDPATGELLDEERAEELRREELALDEMYEAAHGQGAEAYLKPGESRTDEAAMARAENLRQRAEAAHHRLYGRHSDTGAAVGYRAVADDLLRLRGAQVPGRGIAGQASSAFRGRYVMPARLVPLAGASGDYYIPIDHQTAQSYESALLDSVCYRSFARSRGFLNGSLSRFLADCLKTFDRVMAAVRDSLKGTDPHRAALVEDLRQATVAQPPDGSIRTITPQTFAMFTSAFLLNRTEFPKARLQSELGPHAAALAAVAPSIRQCDGYLGFLGVADCVLGGDGFELDQLAARKDDKDSAPRGLRRLWAAFSPSEGTVFDSAKAALPGNATYADFVSRVASQLHAASNPGAAVKNTTPSSVHAGLDVGPEVDRSDVRSADMPAPNPVTVLDAVQEAIASGKTDQAAVDEWARAHAAQSTEKGGATWTEIPEDYESRVGDAPGALPARPDPSTLPSYTPSEEKEIVDVVATLCGLMHGAQHVPSQREFRDMVRLLAPGVRGADWKSMWRRFNEARQEPDAAREWTWEPEEEVDEGIMPDGYEGTNSRAVAMLRSAAMSRLCAIASLTSPFTGRDVQPFLDDVRSTLNQYRQLAPEVKTTDDEQRQRQQKALNDALQYLGWILEPHMQEAAGGAAEREAVFHARLAMMDTDDGRRKVSAHIRALLAPVDAAVDAKGADEYTIVRAPRFGRAAVLLAYLMRLSARPETRGLRDQVASVLSNASPSDPVRMNLSFTQPTDGSNPEPVFLMSPARGKTGSVSMTAVAGTFSRLVNMTATDIANLRTYLSGEIQAAAERGDFDVAAKRHLWTTGGTGVMNAYAKIVAAVFGVDCPLVSALSSRGTFAKIRFEHAMSEKAAERERKAAEAEKRRPRPAKESLFSRLASRFGHAKARGLPLAAKELLDVLDDVIRAVRARGEDARATLDDVEGATASVFVNGPRLQTVRGLDATINSLHGSSEWMQLFQAYADARPVSVMSAETDPERTSRPASSLAITMVGREPALSMFLDRKGEGGLLDVAKRWFGWDRLSDETAAKRLADLRQRLVWPDEAGTHIVAKSISKSAYADEVVEGCRNAFRAETDAKYAEEAFGERFVPRNLVYVPVFSGDHASAILVQVPLAKEFAKEGMDWDKAAEMVSSWLGLDLLGVDPKRSALTCAEAPACSMTGVRVNAGTGEAETDDNGNVIRGKHTMGVVWNSDPEADNEAFIGGAYVYGYGAARQLAMSKDPRASTTKFHLMSSSDDETYGPSFTFGKALFISQGEENPASGQFLADTPAKMLIDLAHSIVGDPTMDSVTLTDKDSVKLALVSNKTVGPDLGDGKPGKLLDLVLKKVDEYVKAGNSMPDGGFDAKAIDDIVGKVKWLDLTGRRERESELAVSQILKDARVVEVKRRGEGYNGSMFALTWRQDNVMAYSAANVSHPAKVADGPLARNYVADALAMAEVFDTWSANTSDPGLFADPPSDADALRDLVGAYSLAGASLAQDEASARGILAQDEEYQAALEAHSGLVPGGPLDRQFMRRAYATWARKRLASMPVEGIDAPLVPNGSWIGKDGKAHSHVNTPWFVDTLQGARTVAKEDRGFTRANKRAAICNVNCRAKGFRHGLYVDAAKLEEKFGASLGATEETGFRRVTLLLEHAVTLAQDPIGAVQNAGAQDVRRALAECLYDHRGTYLSERRWDETVEYTDKEGNKKTRTVHHEAALETSYRDLFTHANQRFDEKAGMRPLFDRAAVYEGMHDAGGNAVAYLGGTMFGLPRTPSYNGSMWLQVVRAGLPVTEAVDERSGRWTDGYEAMVSPDPFTLKILGCDHDGDKAKLYMLGFQTATSLRDVASELMEGQDALLRGGDPAAYNASLVSRGLAQYGKDGGLEFSPAVRRAVSDSFVQLMFDFNRMLPVMSEDGGAPLSTGELRDGGAERGSPYGWTKTRLAPEYGDGSSGVRDVAAWERVLDSADSVTLDAKEGKLLRVPSVAASVQTGAARASAARGVVVALNRALHLAYASGLPVGPFARLSRDGRDWIDFMYHLDGLANMTFDDLKEQICGRLGVTPDMVDVIVADMLAEAADGRLPHTDEQFIRAFANYAALAKREGSSRWLMKKASDPADYRFRIQAFREICGYAPWIAEHGGKPPLPDRAAVRAYAGYGGKVNSNWSKTERPADGTALSLVYDALADDEAAWDGNDVPAMWSAACSLLVWGPARPKSPGLGALMWLGRLAKGSQYSSLSGADRAEVRSVVTCAFGMQALSDAKDLRNAVDFANVDPAEATAAMDAGEAREKWAGIVKELGPDEQPRDFVRRMHRARYLLGRGPGETYAGWGSTCAARHKQLVDDVVRAWGSDGGTLASEAELVTALASAPTIARDDVMALERAAQTTPYALAAFLTLPSVANSPLNAGNAWYVLESAARGMRGEGHPASNANLTLSARRFVEAAVETLGRLVTSDKRGMPAGLGLFDLIRAVPDAGGFQFTPSLYGEGAAGLSRISPSMGSVTADQLDAARSLVAQAVNGDLDGKGYALSSRMLEKLAGHPKVSEAAWRAMGGDAAARRGSASNVGLDVDALKKAFQALDRSEGEGFALEPSAVFGQLLPLYAAMTTPFTGSVDESTRSILALFPDYADMWEAKVREMRETMPDLLDAILPVDFSMAQYKTRGVSDGNGDVYEASAEEQMAAAPSVGKMQGRLGLRAEGATKARKSMASDGGAKAVRGELRKTKALAGVPESDWLRNPRFRGTLALFDDVRGLLFARALDAFAGKLDLGMKKAAAPAVPTPMPAPASVTVPEPAKDNTPPGAKVRAAFTTDNPHRGKDERKFNQLGGLTKFIGFGPGSTGAYAETLAAIANKETYTADDIVGVSVNGDRSNRVPVRGTDVERLVRLACAAGATIIADKESDRTDYNIGERELADLLRELGYSDTDGDGVWRPKPEAPAEPEPVIREEDPLTWRDDVAAAADRMRAVMKLWDCGSVVYTGGDSFKIVGKFHRVGIMSGDAAFDTEVIVTVEDAPSPVDGLADDAFVASALAKAGSPMPLADFRKLPGAQQQAFLAQWAESGRFVPGFTRGAHTAFSVTPEALGVVTGRISLYRGAGGRFDPKSNSLFHEYFHSVMAMVRAVGGMTADDVATLRAKYGEDPRMSGWFDEEKAADEFRAFMEGSLEEAPELDEGARHLSVFGRILEHLRFLFDALFGFSRNWSSADYAKDMEESPLAAIALTGRVRQSLPEKAVRMDFDGKLDSAVGQYLTQLNRWREEASYLDMGELGPDEAPRTMVGGGNAGGRIERLEGTVNDFRRPVRAPLDPTDTLDSDREFDRRGEYDTWPLRAAYGVTVTDFGPPKRKVRLGGGAEEEAQAELDAFARGREVRLGGTPVTRGGPLSMSKLAGAPFSGAVNGWTREELILNAYDRKRFPAGQVPAETAAAMSAVIDRMREIGREPDAKRRLEMLDALKGESPLTEDLVKAVGTTLSKYGPSYGGALADAVAEGTVKPNWTFDSTIAYDIQAPALNDAPVVADETIRDDVAPVAPLVRRAVDAALGPSLRMNRPYARMHMVANAVGRALRTRFGEQASTEALSKLTQARRDAVAPAIAEIAMTAAAQAAHLYGADLSDEQARNLVFNGMVELYSGVDRMVAGDAPVAGSVRTGDPTGRGREAGMVGEAGPHRRTDQNTKSGATAFDLAAAVATATGALPRDIAEAGLADLEQFYRRYGEGSAFRVNVLDRCRSALEMAANADPTRLATDTGYLEDVVGSALSGLRAGLRDTDRGPNGEFGDYELANPSRTANEDAVGSVTGDDEGNIARYRDHIGNADFQSVMKATLSKLHTIAASMKFYRQIGMQPGRPEDSAAIRVLAPNVPEPLSVAATMTAMGASESRFGEPDFEAVDFYDQAWFSAMNPEAWLDSMVRPRFGGVDLRESQQGERDAMAGFRREESLLNSFQARLFGMDVLPGTALTKLSVVKGDTFRLAGGVAKRVKAEDTGGAYGLKDAEGRSVRIKFEGYDRERAGTPLTVNAARENSLWMMAMRVKAAGGRFMLTGVDGITFSVNDSADESHYAFNLVEGRARPGRAEGYSDFDRALLRLMRQWHDDPSGEAWDGVTGESGMDMYNRLVKSACAALRRAKALVEATDPVTGRREGGALGLLAADVNAYVLGALERDGLVVTHDVKRQDGITAPQTATVAFDVDEIDRRWHDEGNEGYAALLAAGREKQWLTFEAYAKPQLELADRVKRFVDERPWLSDGDGAFFHNMTTPLPFTQGSGHFMYQANRRERLRTDKVAGAKGAFEDAFMGLMRERGDAKVSTVAGDSVAYLVRTLFHVREADAEAVRAAMARGDYARSAGIPADPTVDDVLRRCYERLVSMEWAENGDPTVKALGGGAAVSRMAAGYERRRRDAEETGGTVVTGGRGITDELMYKITGCLPANHQLGHAVSNMVDGLLNAAAFRSSVFNMMTTPDGEGRPVCLMRPSETAERDGGITDAMWGAAARWWAELYGAPYDPGKSGVDNARAVYDYVDAREGQDRDGWGHLDQDDIDVPSVSGVLARKWTPERESKLDWMAGGYALGYAKHLFQSTRALGGGSFRTFVHRAWAYSKALSVSFSYFFPIATRFESPIGAIGALATIGGNWSPEKVRQTADLYRRFREALGMNPGWVTSDFLGQRDVFDMMDSNDPFLADLAQFASSVGLTLSDPESNVLENQRGILSAEAKRMTEWFRRNHGSKAAKHVSDFLYAVLERGGERAFTYHLNATKMCVAAQMAQKLRAEAARRGIAFDPVRDLKRYAGYLNAEIGGVDPLSYAWAHPKAQNNLATLFFSWNWTRGAWEAGGGAAIEQLLFGGHRVTKEERGIYLGRWLRMGFWVMYGLPFVAQLVCKSLALLIDPDHEDRDDEPWFPWQNPDGERSSFDLSPLLRAMGKRFPAYAKFRDAHPVLAALPMYGVMVAGGGWKKVGAAALLAAPWHDPDKGGQRHVYGHLAKQAHEFFAWFDDPAKAMFGKMAMVPQRLAETAIVRLGYRAPWMTDEDAGTMASLGRAFLPFSFGGFLDGQAAGGLAAFFPTRKGTSYWRIREDAKRILDRWASNDRRGRASGKRPNGRTPYSEYVGVNHVSVARLVREGVRNGLTEKVAFAAVAEAVNDILTKRRAALMNAMPAWPNDGYDAPKASRLIRECSRLGVKEKDLLKYYKRRLKEQNRWHETDLETRRRARTLIRMTSRGNPYAVTNDAVEENVERYDY